MNQPISGTLYEDEFCFTEHRFEVPQSSCFIWQPISDKWILKVKSIFVQAQ